MQHWRHHPLHYCQGECSIFGTALTTDTFSHRQMAKLVCSHLFFKSPYKIVASCEQCITGVHLANGDQGGKICLYVKPLVYNP